MYRDELVSIIVPVFNVEKYLERCLDSIVNQTYKMLEIILVDDGSCDGSGSICDRYANADKRIKVIHKTNGGLSDARNVGIEESQGSFLTFIDSDDYIHSQMVEILVGNINENLADISFCAYEQGNEQEYFSNRSSECEISSVLLSGKEYLLYEIPGVATTITCNKMYRRYLFEQYKFPYGKLHEDDFLIYKILYKSKKIVFTPQKLYYYYQREGSITHSTKNLVYYDALNERIDFFKQKNERALLIKSVQIFVELYYNDYLEFYKATRRLPEKMRMYKGICRMLICKYLCMFRCSGNIRIKYFFWMVSPRLYCACSILKGRLNGK